MQKNKIRLGSSANRVENNNEVNLNCFEIDIKKMMICFLRHNSYFGHSIITRGSILFLNFQNGHLDPQTLVLGSISSYNYEDDHLSPQTCNLGSISSINYQSAFNFYFQLNFVYSKRKTLYFRHNFIHKLSKLQIFYYFQYIHVFLKNKQCSMQL